MSTDFHDLTESEKVGIDEVLAVLCVAPEFGNISLKFHFHESQLIFIENARSESSRPTGRRYDE
jgi:hypothetical protein